MATTAEGKEFAFAKTSFFREDKPTTTRLYRFLLLIEQWFGVKRLDLAIFGARSLGCRLGYLEHL